MFSYLPIQIRVIVDSKDYVIIPVYANTYVTLRDLLFYQTFLTIRCYDFYIALIKIYLNLKHFFNEHRIVKQYCHRRQRKIVEIKCWLWVFFFLLATLLYLSIKLHLMKKLFSNSWRTSFSFNKWNTSQYFICIVWWHITNGIRLYAMLG